MALTAGSRDQTEKLKALKLLARHLGMVGRLRRPVDLNEHHKLMCLFAVTIVTDPKSSIIRKMASASILDYLIPGWREFIPKELLGPVIEREDKLVRAWRKGVLERCNYQCVDCGATKNLEVHHIAEWAEYPELRIVDENGEVLCNTCHATRHENISSLILARAR
ncbi:HNH endonuclease [Paenibacillus sp. PDC88]|uniref:HNH endonuclease n=1 Tax=Paenibacillus sp. PDC88 TaxID=1884375 RepID=UPI00089D00D6|nr:HNH endonuclease [Paenibacillus sp. PDC88]SDW30854.1 HNH endonuclease [Paenibacillus sp. PDC88]